MPSPPWWDLPKRGCVQSSLLCLHTGFLLGSPTGTRIEGVTEPQTWPVLVSDPRTGLLPVSDFSGLFTDEGDAFLGTRQQLLIHCCYLQGSELPCQAELCFTVNPSPPPASTTQCATPHISGKLATLMLQVPPEVTPEITQDLKRRTVYR